jgi:hypothetical protein
MIGSPRESRRPNLELDRSTFGFDVVEATDRRMQAVVIASATVVVIAAFAGFVALLAR